MASASEQQCRRQSFPYEPAQLVDQQVIYERSRNSEGQVIAEIKAAHLLPQGKVLEVYWPLAEFKSYRTRVEQIQARFEWEPRIKLICREGHLYLVPKGLKKKEEQSQEDRDNSQPVEVGTVINTPI